MRRYAESTSVAVSKSRGEIDHLLRAWGAKGIQWSDDFEGDSVTLRFVWVHDGTDYLARFTLGLPAHADLEIAAIDRRTRRTSQRKLEVLMAARGRREHRLLLFWLKAAMHAVDAGLVTVETLFLPFLEGKDGRTVAEVAVPQLAQLARGSAVKLLGAPEVHRG